MKNTTRKFNHNTLAKRKAKESNKNNDFIEKTNTLFDYLPSRNTDRRPDDDEQDDCYDKLRRRKYNYFLSIFYYFS
jgi:hypothetical protein